MVKISISTLFVTLPPQDFPKVITWDLYFFFFFISDVASVLKYCRLLLFEHDAKFYLEIDSLESAAYLQEDLSRFEHWCDINNMVLNVEKCYVMRYATKKLSLVCNYTFYNTSFLSVDEIKDLSVTFPGIGSFKMHMRNIANKAFRVLGFVTRTSFVSPSFSIIVRFIGAFYYWVCVSKLNLKLIDVLIRINDIMKPKRTTNRRKKQLTKILTINYKNTDSDKFNKIWSSINTSHQSL